VQIGTALHNGVEIIAKIIKDLKFYLQVNDYHSMQELKGLSHQYNTQEVPDY
jgi:dihydroorotate dehydrogenase